MDLPRKYAVICSVCSCLLVAEDIAYAERAKRLHDAATRDTNHETIILKARWERCS